MAFKVNDKAYIVHSNLKILEGIISSCAGGLYLVRFGDGRGIKVKQHRLFETADDAKAYIDQIKRERKYLVY